MIRRPILLLLVTANWTAVAGGFPPPPPPGARPAEASKGVVLKSRRQPADDELRSLDSKRTREQASQDRIKARAWYMTGRYRAAKGDLKGALAAFEQAVENGSTSVRIFREMLQLALRLNRVDDAVRFAEKAIELNPEDYQLLRFLSRQMIRQRKLAEAIRLMERARKSKSIDHHSAAYVSVMRDLGLMYVGTGRQKDAAGCFQVVFEALQDPRGYQLDERTRRALLADPNTSYERIGQIFLEAKQSELAIKAFQAAAKSGQGNPGTLGYNMALVYHKTGKSAQALPELQKYFDRKLRSKGRDAYELFAAVLKDLDKTGELVEKLEALVGHDAENPILQIYLADQYVAGDRLKKARSLYEQALENAEPVDREPAYWGLAVLHRRQTEVGPLLKTLGQAVDGKGDLKRLDEELKQIAADESLRGQLLKEAVKQSKDKNGQAPFARRFVASRLALQADRKDEAVVLLGWSLAARKAVATNKDRLLLEEFRKHVDEFARGLLDQRRYDEAAGLLRLAADDMSLRIFKAQFLFQLSLAYEFGDKTSEALGAIGEARRSSNHPLLHYQEAWIYYHANQWDKAIPLFEQVIKRFPTETSIVRRCQFSLSNIYVEQGDLRKGEAVLEKVFAEDPENPSVNNDLGYLYADQGKKLKQAEQMIRKALKAEPKNSAYQDSMGWVLFKLGRYKESLELLQKASKGREGKDATILEHLGDCYQKLDQAEQAQKVWQKALKVSQDETRPDKKLVERLKQKLGKTAEDPGKTS